MKAFLAFAFVAAFAAASFGVDAIWTNTATTVQSWFTAGNWTDATTGEVLAAPPTGAEDSVTFLGFEAANSGLLRHSVNVTKYGEAASVASVAGNATWRLVLPTSSQSNGNGDILNFVVKDVDSFKGEWQSTGSKKTLVLTAASGVQTLPVVLTSQQFALKVENAETTADILQFRATAGSFKKSGPGDVRIRDVAEPANVVLELEEGNVQIDGRAKSPLTIDSDIMKKAAVHLDASAVKTWQEGSFVDGAGRTRISKWTDVHGGAAYAETWDNSGDQTTTHIKDVQPPFVSPMKSTTGLPLVDFGANVAANVATYGPQAVLRLNKQVNVQEVFYVAALTDGAAVLGDGDDTSFNAAASYVFTDGAGLLKDGGLVRINGNLCWQNCRWVSPYYRMTRTFDSYTADMSQLMLANVKLGEGNAKPVRYLASDRLYKTAGNGTGGIRLGELIIFTTALTEEERVQVTDYLMRKWFAAYDHDDFHVACAADDTSITVPEGRIARIGTLRVNGTKFTKKGGGTLQIGRVYPEDLTITVTGGDVKLNTSVATEAVTVPVGDPQLWLDADYDASVSFEKNGDDVTAWCDRRGNGKKAVRLNFTQITAYPSVDTESLPGRTVLTFPGGSAFQMDNGSGQRESFVAFCYVDDVLGYNVLGSGYPTDRYSGGVSSVFARYAVGPDAMGGGIYSVDGKPVRPFELTGSTFAVGQWHVVHLATVGTYDLERLASNGPRSQTGHIRYGEVITYTTALTPDERRKNIDYLMNKWAGKRHPEYAVPAKDASLAFEGDATFGSETDATFAEVTGSGSLTKTGAGTATLLAEVDDSFTSFDVRGGSLTIKKKGYEDKSVFHFDAMNADSLTTFVVDDGEGGEQTNVATWADTRANGIKATKPGMSSYMNYTNAVLKTYEMRSGVFRPALDFLKCFGRSDANKAGTYLPGAGLNISARSTKIREAHVIFSDNADESSNVIFGDSTDVPFNRGGNRHLFASAVDTTGTKSWTCVQEGGIWLDSEPASASTSLPAGFHLVSITPTANVSIGMIGSERSITGGGNMQAELIAFTEQQTEAERVYLMGSLMHKWFGTAEPVWTNPVTIASLAVARDSVLNVSGDLTLKVAALSGSGTVNASEMTGVAELTLESEDGALVPLTIDGDVGFADAVTVTLGEGLRRLSAGEYVLMNVTGAIANFRPANWTVVSDINPNKTLSVKLTGKAIVLEVRSPGMLLLVR